MSAVFLIAFLISLLLLRFVNESVVVDTLQ
jgi:hypothetical protein